MKSPFFSIITITFNNNDGLFQTLSSIKSQTLKNYELIVIDGYSKDQSINTIEDFKSIITKSISEPDEGIYDAINKGLANISGDWILFLNSGDVFQSERSLELVYNFTNQTRNNNVICCKVNLLFKNQLICQYGNPPTLPHQGLIVNKSILRNQKFDKNFKIFGDRELWNRLGLNNGVDVQYAPIVLSNFDLGGIGNHPKKFMKRILELSKLKLPLRSFLISILLEVTGFLYYLLFGLENFYIKWTPFIINLRKNMKNNLTRINQIISPFINIRAILFSCKNIFRIPIFFTNYIKYKRLSQEKVALKDIYPCLNDKDSSSQTGRGHYFYQDIWALKKISLAKPNVHVDIGSRIDGFVGQCSAICNVKFVDIRPIDLGIKNIEVIEGSILNLPFENDSIDSLSCLHVAEHIGLGRYGDPIDPAGTQKAINELKRILKPGGNLYFSVPIGSERVMYNAHRISNPQKVIDLFYPLKMASFSIVNDNGAFIENFEDLQGSSHSLYSCGLFHFTKD